MTTPITGTFHDAITGQTVVRELTPEEVAQLPSLPQAPDETPSPD